MRVAVVPVIVLVALLVGLVPLAFASPPDETWLPGFYDNADYDDVVIALTFTVGAADAVATPDLGRTTELVQTLCPPEPSAPASALRSPYRLRAPPLG
jgi:hypothetical protein